ncbi:MAG: hypothetical protein KH358_15680 [Odoribacter splanchnicus]|nr:hypothetical protein [Odoribacter splanchnicus]
MLCTNQLRIVWLSSTYEGHVHDKKICDEEPLLLPKGIRLWQDTGFIGHRPDGVEICMPKCRIVKERFRCHKFGFEDMVILIACGLHNFRISYKMSHITI